MQNFLVTVNLLLKQTEAEKRLTILYVGLFVFLCLLLFLDAREGKRLVGGNKLLAKIFAVVLILAILTLFVLYLVL